jgi:hypothetical protein
VNKRKSSLTTARGGWLHYLFNHLNCPFEQFGKNKVAFITFNYDRSLEHYLFTCLYNSYGKSADECAHQLKQIPIIHLHGDLGALPWQTSDANVVRDYDPTITPGTLKIAASRIKIIHEDIAGRDKEFTEAKRLFSQAAQIYFLGFGYDPTNMTRLGVNSIRERIAAGTGWGLTPHERELKKAATGRKVEIVDVDCIGLLRNVVVW